MDSTGRTSLRQRVGMWFESLFLGKLIPRDTLPPVLRWLFRTPLFLQRHGLGFLIPSNVLVLTTTGRRSGRPHATPVEFGPGARPGTLLVMAGWDGRTDWYRNARKNPCVHIWQRGREWDAMAEPVPDGEVAATLKQMAHITPASNRIWSRWAGIEMDGSDARYLAAAPHFPSFYLVPVDRAASPANTRVEDARRMALQLLDQSRSHTRSVFSRLDPELQVHQDESGWRVRDVVGHIAAWNAEAARSLEAHADGGQYICLRGRAAYDDYNGPAAAERRTWSLDEVWAEYEASHDALRKAVEGMPAGRWEAELVYPWSERGTVERLIKRMMKHETADHCDRMPEAAL